MSFWERSAAERDAERMAKENAAMSARYDMLALPPRERNAYVDMIMRYLLKWEAEDPR